MNKLYKILAILKIFVAKYRHKQVFYNQIFNIKIEKDFILNLDEGLKLKIQGSLYARTNFIIRGRGEVTLGKNLVFNNYCSINCFDKIEIGDNCMFGENVKIYDHNHIFNKKNINLIDSDFNKASIKIGKNVWIGANVTILKGIEIGENSVVAAGCVVRESIPPNSIYLEKKTYKIEPIIYK
ncbi:MAG: acyltransferase [Fusobacteriaceae bacterium]